jgi:dolichyl-phosphate-mannose--protein O-mannosyl transferase
VPNPLRSWWFYENQVFQFNANLTSPHPYESNPWSWLVMGRPVSFYYESPTYGQSGCTVKNCSSAILALGTPPLWWVATAGLVYALWRWVFRRDWRSGAVLAGMASLWLPWLHYSSRTIFEFYAVSFAPFMVLSATLVVGALLGSADASPTRRMWGAVGAGVIVLSVVGAFMWFYPIYTAHVIPYNSWNARMWFSSWI